MKENFIYEAFCVDPNALSPQRAERAESQVLTPFNARTMSERAAEGRSARSVRVIIFILLGRAVLNL